MDDDEVPTSFGYDVVDAIGWQPPEMEPWMWEYDTLDVIESRKRDLMAHCTTCEDGWLAGPEALESGRCWKCRSA